MKITFLGTSAGEEYPGIWCDCENCARARSLGGRNIRRNSAIMIDGDAMIDIGKTAHIQAERFNKNLRKIKTLLVTHSHSDHFDLHTMWARQMTPGVDAMSREEQNKTASPRFTKAPVLDMFGNERVEDALRGAIKGAINCDEANINFTRVKPFENYKADNIEFFTLDGNHSDGDMRSINYIISRGGVTFLYMLDSGWPFEETLNAMKKYKYDFIITEGTFGLGMDSLTHMNFDKCKRLLGFFNENKLWKNKPEYYLTHIAPHWSPPHDEYAPAVEAAGMKLAYDGLEIIFD